MNRTPIEWTDFSANPLKYRTADGRVVWACEKLSPGCTNCYAEDLSHRYGGTRRAGDWNAGTMATLTPFLEEAELRKMLTATSIGGKAVDGSKVFVGDMTDIFGSWVPDALLDRLFAVFALRQDVTFQVLTKRADRMRDYFAAPHRHRDIELAADETLLRIAGLGTFLRPLPLPNVWLGVSVEDQKRADERIPQLLQTPAAVRFISAEPLLGPVDLSRWLYQSCCGNLSGGDYLNGEPPQCCSDPFDPLDWIIVGGESGAGARPFDIAWARSIVQQCQSSGVPVFAKQMGSNAVCRNDECDEGWPGCTVPIDDDYEPREQGETAPLVFRDRKGGDPSEWSEDLRIREFPSTVGVLPQ